MARRCELRHNSVVKIDDLSTRDAVARSVLENGPSTAVVLGERLGLTPAGIRRHLDLLVADGILEAREPHQALTRGRGRPSKVFVMTDSGREKFEHSYDDLAVAALKFMSAQSGGTLVKAFAQSRADDIERKGTVALVKRSNKSEALATFLTEQGYAASIESRPLGEQLCQHHCPIAHVAAEFPALCEAETEAFSRMLGTHVQRLATIAHGDGVCTTYIPNTVKTKPSKKITAGKAHS
ncbi:helix-turn-helix transcriptional regulator [Candidatus Planktophila dulcis]|uniref:helix-turn-helix transcriptional regulator n=1 Tax=Candidatus Planktophila dulcis TaxID=1884914 RepID=UPI003BEF1A9F